MEDNNRDWDDFFSSEDDYNVQDLFNRNFFNSFLNFLVSVCLVTSLGSIVCIDSRSLHTSIFNVQPV